MEIERKWMVEGWPENLPLLYEQSMRQGYLTVHPTVRIREETVSGEEPDYVLCIKTGSGIARRELEFHITAEEYAELETMIGLPLVPKIRRTYLLPDGRKLEVNHVDEGQPTEFWYAEIEYESVEEARGWEPQDPVMAAYLCDDVTDEPGQTMGAYWLFTRFGETVTDS